MRWVQAALDEFPLVRRDDARDQVEGENFLRALVVVVDRERDALRQEGRVGEGALALELALVHALKTFQQLAVVRARLPGRAEHFVEETLGLITVEKFVHVSVLPSAYQSTWRTKGNRLSPP